MLLHGFNATVVIDGIPLHEHGVELDTSTGTCWIESAPGQQFNVRWERDSSAAWLGGVGGYLYVDNLTQCADGLALDPNSLAPAVHAGIRDTPTSSRAFLFAEIVSLPRHCFISRFDAGLAPSSTCTER